MHKKLWDFAKGSMVGLLSLVVFLHIYQIIGKYRWNFDVMNGAHWGKVWWAWKRGWVINTIEEWAFALFILSIVPMFAAFYAIVLRKNLFAKIGEAFLVFLKTLMPVHKIPQVMKKAKEKREENKEQKAREALEIQPNGNLPQEIFLARRESKAEAYGQPKESPKEELPVGTEPVAERHHEATHHTHAVKDKKEGGDSKIDDILSRLEKHQEKAHQEKAHQEKAEKNKAVEKRPEKHVEKPAEKSEEKPKKPKPESKPLDPAVLQKFKEKGYDVIQNPTVGDKQVSFLALGQHRIIVGNVLNQDYNWVADETSLDGMPAMWTNQMGADESPVQGVIAARRQLKKDLIEVLENESVEAVVCMSKGKIENLDDVKSKWRRESVTVVNATKQAKTPFLKNLGDYISENTTPMGKDKTKKIQDILSGE
ncbi:MAG: hypothetical protein JW812_01000 [Alphaproteobacteria bacterium]|nr:hypothetical protein [Alphaproteobacteria bacterium]MBN2779634.1 hypothetical protein [Alphaproteobacteria bacterium]